MCYGKNEFNILQNFIFCIEHIMLLRNFTFNTNISAKCQRCKRAEGDLLHMLWNCPILNDFWKYIIDISSKVIGIPIRNDSRIWILGDSELLNSSHHKKYFTLLAGTAGEKCILVNWKSTHSPSRKQWINELISLCTPEKILFNVRKSPKTFGKIWGSFLEH